MAQEQEVVEEKEETEKEELEQKVIQALKETPGLSFAELVERTGGDPAKVRGVIGKLTRQGTIYSTGKLNDKRFYAAESMFSEEEQPKSDVPPPILPTTIQALRELLDTFNIPVNVRNRVLKIIEISPVIKNDPNQLFSLLVGMRIDPTYARMIVDTYVATMTYQQQTQAQTQTRYITPQTYTPPFSYYQPLNQPPTTYQNYPYQPQQPPAYYPPPPSHYPPPYYPPPPSEKPREAQPIVIRTGELRKIKRPLRNEKGEIMRDEQGNIIYEEVEEPVTIVAGTGSDTLTARLLEKLFERSPAETALQAKLEEEREKRIQAQIEAVKTETKSTLSVYQKDITDLLQKIAEKLGSMPSYIDEVSKKIKEEVDRRFEKLDYEKKIEEAKREAEARIGEPAIVAVTREMRKGLETLASRMPPFGLPQPPQLQPPQQQNPEQVALYIQKMREQLKQKQQPSSTQLA